MRIYFSGGGGMKDTPEVLIPELKPHIMLTFHALETKQSSATSRLKSYLRQKPKKKKK